MALTLSCDPAASVRSCFSLVGVQDSSERLRAVRSSIPALSRQPRAGRAGSPTASSCTASLRHKDLAAAGFSSSFGSRARQSFCSTISGCAVATTAGSSSASVPGVSSKLPKASGCDPGSILSAEACTGISSTNDSVSASGNGGFGKAITAGALAGASTGTLAGASTGAAAGVNPACAMPARTSAAFTMEISGSGGTNGFFNTPSAPTRCASCSSSGSKAPTRRITGMCDRAGSSLTYLQTSYPFLTGMKTSASTRSGFMSEIFRTAASPLPTATTSMP